VKLHGEVNL